jgi:AraC-like DNA-binding protein
MPEASCGSAPGLMEFSTHDLDAARELLCETFVEHDVHLSGNSGLDFNLALAQSPRLTVSQISYGADVRFTTPSMLDCYVFNLPVTGESTVEQNGVQLSTGAGRSGAALLPNAPLQVCWSGDARQYVIKVPSELLDAHAAKLAGLRRAEVVHFDLIFDLASSEGRALLATAGFMFTQLTHGGLAMMPAACKQLETVFMTQLVMTVPNQLTPVLRGAPTRMKPSRIREAIDLIEDDPLAICDLADLAAATGVGARSLQAGFHAAIGLSPMSFIRGARLDRAREELVLGSASTVTEAAGRWGFYHLSRFGAYYRDRFGELPSETLQRRRSDVFAVGRRASTE